MKNPDGGIYLVVDPATESDKIRAALEGGIDILQIWNNWKEGQDKHQVIESISAQAHQFDIPVIINEEWELLQTTSMDGVHFDNPPADITDIRKQVGREFLCGITCGNDLSRVEWAEKNNLSYISFCSMFPSPSAGVCEIVQKETVQRARQMTKMPIFLAGGITLDNLSELSDTGMNGIAIISAIMKSENPLQATKAFKIKMHETITH